MIRPGLRRSSLRLVQMRQGALVKIVVDMYVHVSEILCFLDMATKLCIRAFWTKGQIVGCILWENSNCIPSLARISRCTMIAIEKNNSRMNVELDMLAYFYEHVHVHAHVSVHVNAYANAHACTYVYVYVCCIRWYVCV